MATAGPGPGVSGAGGAGSHPRVPLGAESWAHRWIDTHTRSFDKGFSATQCMNALGNEVPKSHGNT